MDYLLSKCCKKDQKKLVTLEDLQAILLRTQSPQKKFNLSTGDYNEVYSKIYVGDW